MARTAQGIAYDVRNQLYAKIQALSFSYHDQAQTGQLMTRATSDVDMVQRFVGQGFLMMVGAAIMMVGSLVFLFVTNWQLSLVMLVIVPFTFVVFGTIASRIRPMFKIVQERLAKLNTVLQENLAGVRVVKAFVREPYEAERYAGGQPRTVRHQHPDRQDACLCLMPMIFFISNMATLCRLLDRRRPGHPRHADPGRDALLCQLYDDGLFPDADGDHDHHHALPGRRLGGAHL